MPKYKCTICGTIKQMSKLDSDCPFCSDDGLGQMALITGQEGAGVKRRILGAVREDEDNKESGDWL